LSEWLLQFAAAVGLTIATALPASAALQGEVRFTPAQNESVWVGQEIELYLELWSDGLSFGDQQFVLPEVAGGFLLQGDANTVKLSETREGAPWQGLRYTFFLYPQTGGRLQVPAFDVSFSSRAGFDSEPAGFRFRTEPIVVEAQWPPGARAGGLLVTTTAFSLEARWDRTVPSDEPLQLLTGDAITLEVQRQAADVPGMVFAPLAFPSIDGLGVYADNPRVEDRVNRGELSGQRVDRITFVCEKAGSYEIPELQFQWWDPERQSLSEKVIPALQLEVSVNPAYRSASDAGAERAVGRWFAGLLLAVLAALLIAAVGRRYASSLQMRLRGWRQTRRPAAVGPPQRDGRLQSLNPRTAFRSND